VLQEKKAQPDQMRPKGTCRQERLLTRPAFEHRNGNKNAGAVTIRLIFDHSGEYCATTQAIKNHKGCPSQSPKLRGGKASWDFASPPVCPTVRYWPVSVLGRGLGECKIKAL